MNTIEQAVEFYNADKFEQAENIACDILKKDPANNEALDVLAAIFLKINKLNLLKTATKKDAHILRNVAVFLTDLHMPQQSIILYNRALELEPDDYIGWNNMGMSCEEIGLDGKALEFYKKSIQVTKNYNAYYNLGVIHRRLKDTDQSIKYFKMALSYQPDDWQTHYSLSMSYLMDKQFTKGYQHFIRKRTTGTESLKNNWDGNSYPEKTILVFCDYGLGDGLMFARYFPFLKQHFKTIKVCCHAPLKTLFEQSFDGIEFYPKEYLKYIDYDFSTLAMNLPYYLKIDFDNIPFPDGYLKADENKVQKYRDEFFNNDKFKIGICWVGGEREKRNAKNRSIPLYLLQPMFYEENTVLYSFQKDDVLNEIENFPELINIAPTFNDFSDTMAAMKNLDLMISIDSSPVHLAGAAGVKTFLMLPYCSEWRWFKDTKQTPWYNSVELFQQTMPYDWNDVVDDITKRIKELSH